MRIGKAILILLLGLQLLAAADAQSCKRVRLDTPTRWGGNQVVEVDLRDHPVRTALGTVSAGGDPQPLAGVLLQVYKRKHADPLYRSPEPGDPRPIAACITGEDGMFRFHLRSGEYELRASMGMGMNVTHIYFSVRRNSHDSSPISVTIFPGT